MKSIYFVVNVKYNLELVSVGIVRLRREALSGLGEPTRPPPPSPSRACQRVVSAVKFSKWRIGLV